MTVLLAQAPRALRIPEWSTLKPVLIFHLITRATILLALLIGAVISDRTFPEIATRWDGIWYERVANDGYPSPLPTWPNGNIKSSTAAFFPLFPLLAKGLMTFGIPFWLSGMIINLIASTAAVLMIVLATMQYLDRHTAQLVGCLWTTFPVSVVLTITYTEALFTFFGAAAVFFLLRRDWILAGLAAALAGTVRPTGIVFAGAVGLAALVAIARDREWRSLLGAAIAPLGCLGTMAAIGIHAGRLDAWHITERDGWHAEIDFGRTWLEWLDFSPSDTHQVLHLITALFGIVLLILTLTTIALRPPLPIIGMVAVGAFMAFGYAGVGMNAAPRVMMTMFPILAPVAILLSRLGSRTQRIVLGCGALAAALIGMYYFAFAPLPV